MYRNSRLGRLRAFYDLFYLSVDAIAVSFPKRCKQIEDNKGNKTRQQLNVAKIECWFPSCRKEDTKSSGFSVSLVLAW